MLFWVATQVLRACKVSTTPPKSKIIVTKVAPRSFLLPVCCPPPREWTTDFENCCSQPAVDGCLSVYSLKKQSAPPTSVPCSTSVGGALRFHRGSWALQPLPFIMCTLTC